MSVIVSCGRALGGWGQGGKETSTVCPSVLPTLPLTFPSPIPAGLIASNSYFKRYRSAP